MIESKAIDNKVKDLLSNVRSQAERYKELFHDLKNLGNTIESELSLLKENSQHYDEKFSLQLSNLENQYNNSVKDLEDRIDKIKDFELNHKKINQVKEEFESLIANFSEQSNEFIQSFLDFKSEIEKKFFDEVKSFRNYTDKEIELEIRSLESRIYDRIRKVDRHLEHYDNKIYDANQLQESTNKSIYKQLRSIEGTLETIKAITEASSRTFNNDLRNTESHLLEKIDIIEERQEKLKKIEFLDDIIELDKALSKQKNEIDVVNEKVQTTLHNYEKQISTLKDENKKLEAEINTSKSSSTIAIVTAVISLILMVVVSFLT